MLQIEIEYVRREEAKRSDQCSTNIDIQHLGQHQFTQLRRKKTGLDVPAKDHTGGLCLSGSRYLSGTGIRAFILLCLMEKGNRAVSIWLLGKFQIWKLSSCFIIMYLEVGTT